MDSIVTTIWSWSIAQICGSKFPKLILSWRNKMLLCSVLSSCYPVAKIQSHRICCCKWRIGSASLPNMFCTDREISICFWTAAWIDIKDLLQGKTNNVTSPKQYHTFKLLEYWKPWFSTPLVTCLYLTTNKLLNIKKDDTQSEHVLEHLS